jgi:hypothetical protein
VLEEHRAALTTSYIMICRWANPESLKVYARHGTSLHITAGTYRQLGVHAQRAARTAVRIRRDSSGMLQSVRARSIHDIRCIRQAKRPREQRIDPCCPSHQLAMPLGSVGRQGA